MTKDSKTASVIFALEGSLDEGEKHGHKYVTVEIDELKTALREANPYALDSVPESF